MSWLRFLAILFLITSVAFASGFCGDGVCNKTEYESNCIDCRSAPPPKNYCLNDGICTRMEKAFNCPDCEEGFSMSTGLVAFIGGTTLVVGIFFAIVILAVYYGTDLRYRLRSAPSLRRKRHRL